MTSKNNEQSFRGLETITITKFKLFLVCMWVSQSKKDHAAVSQSPYKIYSLLHELWCSCMYKMYKSSDPAVTIGITYHHSYYKELVRKPSKLQRNKQRSQDLFWKVHDPTQSFVLCSHNLAEL